jgi:hypothetical protein
MSSYARWMKQDITYWAPSTQDVYGKWVFTAPLALTGRWEDRTELIINKAGQEVGSRSRVYLTQAVEIDGYLYKGTSSATDPTTIRDAYPILVVGNQPDLRNLKQLNVAMV